MVWESNRKAVQSITYLAILKLKLELDFGTLDGLIDELRGYPSLGGIRLPGPRADIIGRCHGGNMTRRKAGFDRM